MANISTLGATNLVGQDYVATTPGGSPPAGTGVGGAVVAPVNPVTGTGNMTAPNQTASQTDKTTVDYTKQDPTKALDSTLSGGVVQGYLNDLLSQDSAYMRNAQQQGLNQAAGRGLRNSSIAAGAAQASSIAGANPILNNIMSLNNQREQQAYQAEQAEFDRGLTVNRDNANMANQVNLSNTQQQNQVGMNNTNLQSQTDQANAQLNQQANLANMDAEQRAALQNAQNQQQANLQNSQLQWQAEQAALGRTQSVNDKMLAAELQSKQAAQDYQFKNWLQDAGAKQQDWLNSQQYSREFSGMVSQMQLSTSADMFKQIVNAAINNPQTFPPEVAAGMQNYFTGNWAAVLGKYFPSTMGGN